jgi:hypothetical protein
MAKRDKPAQPATPRGWGSSGGGTDNDQARGKGGVSLPRPAAPFVPKKRR